MKKAVLCLVILFCFSGVVLADITEKFKVMCWMGGQWKVCPAEINDCLFFTNKIGVHNHVRLIYDKVLKGDFSVGIELQGEISSIVLGATDGSDWGISFTPHNHKIDIVNQAQKFIISRKGQNITVTTASGKSLEGNIWSSFDFEADYYLSIGVPTGNSVKICTLNFKIEN